MCLDNHNSIVRGAELQWQQILSTLRMVRFNSICQRCQLLQHPTRRERSGRRTFSMPCLNAAASRTPADRPEAGLDTDRCLRRALSRQRGSTGQFPNAMTKRKRGTYQQFKQFVLDVIKGKRRIRRGEPRYGSKHRSSGKKEHQAGQRCAVRQSHHRSDDRAADSVPVSKPLDPTRRACP